VAVSERLVDFLPGPKPARLDDESGDRFGWITRHARSVASTAGTATPWCSPGAHLHRGARRRRPAPGSRTGRAQRELDPSPAGRVLRCRLRPPLHARVVFSASALRKDEGIKALDVAKRLLEEGFHSPTVYFPLIVDEALMIEPTETESPQTLEALADALERIVAEARSGTIPPPRRRARRRCGASTRPGGPHPRAHLRRPRGLSPPAGSVPQRGAT